LSPAHIQPIVSDDVAAALAEVTLAAPVNGMIEIAGPERLSLDELVRRFLRGKQDARQVVTDVHARYFGIDVNDQSLTPGDNPRIGRRVLVTGSAGPQLKGELPRQVSAVRAYGGRRSCCVIADVSTYASRYTDRFDDPGLPGEIQTTITLEKSLVEPS
jgi:hypothetical protein